MEKGSENNFEKKHPKLNLFLGILIILIILIMALVFLKFLLKYIGIGISSFISWLKSVASSIEAVVLVALITGAVSIIGVVFTSVISKVIEYKQKRREYLYQKREKPYEDFVDMVYKIQEYSKKNEKYPEDEMLKDMYKFSKQLTLWGSNRVIKKWLKFRESSNTGISGVETMFVMEDILYAMRKDMGLKRLGEGRLLSFFVNDMKNVKRPHK